MKRALLALAAFVLLCGMFAAAEINGITVQIIDQTADHIVCRVTNQSSKPVAAYTVGIDAVFSSGQSSHSEQSIKTTPIPPGSFYDFKYYDVKQPQLGALVDVHVTPAMVIYTDQTYETVDKETYHRFVDQFVAEREAQQVALKAIQQAIANGGDPKPAIEEALKQSRLATASPRPGVKSIVLGRPLPPDDQTLERILADLGKPRLDLFATFQSHRSGCR